MIYLGLPSPVAELAATKGGYRGDSDPATFEGFDPKTPRRKNVLHPFWHGQPLRSMAVIGPECVKTFFSEIGNKSGLKIAHLRKIQVCQPADKLQISHRSADFNFD